MLLSSNYSFYIHDTFINTAASGVLDEKEKQHTVPCALMHSHSPAFSASLNVASGLHSGGGRSFSSSASRNSFWEPRFHSLSGTGFLVPSDQKDIMWLPHILLCTVRPTTTFPEFILFFLIIGEHFCKCQRIFK